MSRKTKCTPLRENYDSASLRTAIENVNSTNPPDVPKPAGRPESSPTIHGFTLQPVSVGLTLALERVQSPLLNFVQIVVEEMARPGGADNSARIARAAARFEKLNPPLSALAETAFCFIHTPDFLRDLLDKGRPAFREAALREISDRLSPAHFNELLRAAAKFYAESFVAQKQIHPQPK